MFCVFCLFLYDVLSMARPRTKGDGPNGEVLNEFGEVTRTRKSMIEASKELRQRTTIAEELLWEALKEKKLSGLKFYRQMPIDRFIVDFYCPRLKLAIELDGGIHDDPDQDDHNRLREQMLSEREIRIIRFRNKEVIRNLHDVCTRIKDACFVK